ncbi:MAG TPA: site-specific integrase [Chloroflexota bacterium]
MSELAREQDGGESWLSLSPDDRRERAEQACRNGDRGALWSLLCAHLEMQRPLSRHTIRAYRQSLDLLLDRCASDAILQLRDEDVDSLIRDMEHMGASPSTVKVRLAGLRALYRALLWAGATDHNPFAEARPDPTREVIAQKREQYSPAEREALLDAASPADRALILLLAAGIRISNCVALRWTDIDWSAQRISVPTRPGKPDRLVLITPSLMDALQYLPRDRAGSILGFSTDVRARQRIQRLCEQTGVPYRGVHGLKQTGTVGPDFGTFEIERRERRPVKLPRDPFTGLPNVDTFQREVERTAEVARQAQTSFCVLTVRVHDLDQIEQVHGRQIKEAAQRALAARLDRSRRGNDLVSVSPDSIFYILLRDVATDADLRAIANRVRSVICSHPIRIKDLDVAVAATVMGTCGIDEPLNLLKGRAETPQVRQEVAG